MYIYSLNRILIPNDVYLQYALRYRSTYLYVIYKVFNKYIMTNFDSASDVIINTTACMPPGIL